MKIDEPFTVQFVHDQHLRHNFFSGLFSDLQKLGGIFVSSGLFFNLFHNAKFSPVIRKQVYWVVI